MTRLIAAFAACLLSLPAGAHDKPGLDKVRSEAALLELSLRAGEPVCTKACFPAEQDAHQAAAEAMLDIALETRREVNWRVYRLADGSYTYSYPAVGLPEAATARMAPIAARHEYLSAGHVHWENVPDFSPLDWQWVTGNRRDLYLATAERVLRVLTPSAARTGTRRGLSRASHAVSAAGRPVASVTPPPRGAGKQAQETATRQALER